MGPPTGLGGAVMGPPRGGARRGRSAPEPRRARSVVDDVSELPRPEWLDARLRALALFEKDLEHKGGRPVTDDFEAEVAALFPSRALTLEQLDLVMATLSWACHFLEVAARAINEAGRGPVTPADLIGEYRARIVEALSGAGA
jgi:hypothetical protein